MLEVPALFWFLTLNKDKAAEDYIDIAMITSAVAASN
jgi:hypothetical protein